MVNAPGEGNKRQRSLREALIDTGKATIDNVRSNARALAVGTAFAIQGAGALAGLTSEERPMPPPPGASAPAEDGEAAKNGNLALLESSEFADNPTGKKVPAPNPEKAAQIQSKVDEFKAKTGLPLDVFYTEGTKGPQANIDLRPALKAAVARGQQGPVLAAGFFSEAGAFVDALRILLGILIIVGPAVFLGVAAHKLFSNKEREGELSEQLKTARADEGRHHREYLDAQATARDFLGQHPGIEADDPALVAEHGRLTQAVIAARRNARAAQQAATLAASTNQPNAQNLATIAQMERQDLDDAQDELRAFETANADFMNRATLRTQYRALLSREATERGEDEAAHAATSSIVNTDMPDFRRGRNWRRLSVVGAVLAGALAPAPLAMQVFPGADQEAAADAAQKKKVDKKVTTGNSKAAKAAAKAARKALQRMNQGGKSNGASGQTNNGEKTKEQGGDTPEVTAPTPPTQREKDEATARDFVFSQTGSRPEAIAACGRLLSASDMQEAIKALCAEVK